MKKYQELYDFIDKAENSKKYLPNTARAYKVALKVFEPHLNETEKNSIEEFKKNIDQTSRIIFGTNKFTSGSLATYKSRAMRVIGDYEKYGTDPIKMNSWSPSIVNNKPKKSSEKKKVIENKIPSHQPEQNVDSQQTGNPSNKIEIFLRKDAKALIMFPQDVTKEEITKIKNILDSFTGN